MRETIAKQLLATRKAFVAADIEPAGLDARLLMQAATGLSHEELVASPETEMSPEQSKAFADFAARRLRDEPVSRILGTREFYGRNFEVTPAVLDPRADTEALIELVLQLCKIKPARVLDVGTGSGAIAITLLCEIADATGVAVDVSADALHVARINAQANGVSDRLQFHQGSWFAGLTEKFDIIASNPPYIAHGEIAGLGDEVKNFDPHLALDGGADGLFAYRALATGAAQHLNDGGIIVLEIGAGQAADVIEIFNDNAFHLCGQRNDLGGHMRALAFNL